MAVGFGSYLRSTYLCGLCVHLGSVSRGDNGIREHLLLGYCCQMFLELQLPVFSALSPSAP